MNDLLEKLLVLHAAGTQVTPENAKEVASYLYDALTVVDRKAATLLVFDAILVSAASFGIERESTRAQRALTLFVIAVVLLAAALCLTAAQISYPFFEKIVVTVGQVDFSVELRALADALVRRTLFYRCAWWLSIGSLPLFLVMFASALGLTRRARTST